MKIDNNVILTDREKQRWILFHLHSYKQNLKLAEHLLITYPRWSIIVGYYAMHDITKLYIGKIHNIKITGQNVHARAVEKLREVITKDREKVIKLLEEAENQMEIALRMKEKVLPHILTHGKRERSKSQYYQTVEQEDLFKATYSVKASEFIENIVKPYLRIFEGLL